MRDEGLSIFKQVFDLLTRGIDFDRERRRAFEVELGQLIAPHMPVLAHRRAKLLTNAGPERWSSELDLFMKQSLWPVLGADREYAERNRRFVILMLDVAIEREQLRLLRVATVGVPLVSRFDATWAQ